MFNAFNGQHQGNAAGWLGNLQGNYSAPTVHNSYPQANGYPGHHDPYAHYGGFPAQTGWQPHDPAMAYHQHQHNANMQQQQQQQYNYQYYTAAPQPEQPPPLPDGAPPPLPPTPVEPPPPLPPDGPLAPPLPPQPPPPPLTATQMPNHLPPQPTAPGGFTAAGEHAWGAPPGQYAPPQPPPGGAGAGQASNGGPWGPHLHQSHVQPPPYHHHLGYTNSSPYPPYQPQPPQTMPPGAPLAQLQPQSLQTPGFTQLPPAPPGSQAHPHQHPHPHQQHPHQQASGPGMPSSSWPTGTAAAGLQQVGAPPPPTSSSAAAAAAAAGAGTGMAAAAPSAAPAPVVIDITRLIRPPHRATRPRKLLLVLRGLPGSGKSTLAKKIREAELEAGAEAPRLHSIDDYYMQEVEEEVVEEEGGRKKRRKVTELKYVYEPEMEGTYFRDLVRAVGRSCEDRRHSFVVVDAPVLRAEQLRELMAVGQRANFECFALRPLETDPAVCAAPGRNTHGHSAADLREMAAQFEAAPLLYTQVSAVSLFGGPVVGEETGGSGGRSRSRSGSGGEIQEVEMDMEDSEDEDSGGRDGSGDDAGTAGRRPTSRWHDGDADEDGDDDVAGDRRRRSRQRKRDKAKARAVADIDDKGILSGLNDALAAAPNGAAPGGGGAALGTQRPLRPLRPALRRPSTVTAAEGTAAAATVANGATTSTGDDGGGGDTAAAAKRRVWWPDLGRDAAGPGPSPREVGTAGAAGASELGWGATAVAAGSAQLVAVVYLEGLGPPPELEDLPYGYQRRGRGDGVAGPSGGAAAAAAAPGGGGGCAGAAVGGQGRLGGHHAHSFREQAKAEHESEHDLFRRLLLGRMTASTAGRGPGGDGGGKGGGGAPDPAPLGLFAAPAEEDDEDGE